MLKNKSCNTSIVIPKEFLGIDEFDLIYDIDSNSFFKDHNKRQQQNNNNKIFVELNSFSMKEICHVCSLPQDFFSFPINSKFKKSFQQLNLEKNSTIPWSQCLPSNLYKNEVKEFTNQIKKIFENVDLSYYVNVYKKPNSLLNQYLFPVKIDCQKYSDYLLNQEDKTQNYNVHLQSFMPENGYAQKVKYSRIKTITGRLSITEGPNILLLPKKFRDILISKHGSNGSIVYLDFKSLEPRVLLSSIYSLYGYPSPIIYNPDIYTAIIEQTDLKNKGIPRSVIKFLTIEKLYGATDSVIVNHLMSNYPNLSKHQCEELIDLIDDVFKLTDYKQQLIQQFIHNDCKFIENFYGRKIKCEESYKLPNYVTQSTAVDVALLAFQNILDWILSKNLLEQITPLFVLHDALILDVHHQAKQNHLQELINVGSTPSLNFPSDMKFFLEASNGLY